MRRNYYYRLLLTYLPVLTCTIAVIILVFIAIINNLTIENTKQANLATTQFMSQVVDDTLKNIGLEVYKQVQDNDGMRLFFTGPAGDPDIIRSSRASNVMSAMMVRFDMIYSISLYRTEDDMVLDQSTIRPLAEFPDHTLISAGMQSGVYSRWTAPRTIEIQRFDGIKQERVVSLVYKIPNHIGLVLVNVSIKALDTILSDMVNTTTGVYDLLDQDGNSFFGSAHVLSDNGLIDASIRSEYTGWTLRSGLNNGKTLSLVFHRSILWIVWGVAIILLGLYLTVFFTRRNYQPVKRIMQRIASVARQEDGGAGAGATSLSEFELIDQVVQELALESSTQHERVRLFREQQLFQGLLHGTLKQSTKENERFLAELGYGSPKLAAVALMEIDDYTKFSVTYSAFDQALLKFVKRSVAKEILQQGGQPHFVEWISKNRMAIILFNAADQPTLEETLHNYAEHIRQWIDDNLQYTVTFGLGVQVAHLSELASSYETAISAINFKMSIGNNSVIAIADFGLQQNYNVLKELKLIQQLIQTFRLGNPEWERHACELFGQLTRNWQPKDDTIRLLQYFLYLLSAEFKMMGKEAMRLWGDTHQPRLEETLAEKDTLAEIEPVFLQTLRDCFNQLRSLNRRRDNFALLQEIRQYVSDCYHNPDLSLMHLSERFEVNAKYLSQLFKEETGVNFSDFLIELRINGAKRLLEETNDSLQLITDQIGYTNAISFSRLFKKQVGMTPGSYREQQRKARKMR